MTGSEIRSKRMSEGIPGAIVCARAGMGRNRLSDIERDYVIASDDELARLDSAIEQIISSRQKLGKLAKDAWLTLREVQLRPALRPQDHCLRSLGVAAQVGEAYEVGPHGLRFDSPRKMSSHQAQLLVEGEVRSPTGRLRYLKTRTHSGFEEVRNHGGERNGTI
jgi:transcriptional regulator with XRE-family HTH domain